MSKLAICNELFTTPGPITQESEPAWMSHARLANELGYTGLEVAPFTLVEEGRLPTGISSSERATFKQQVAECGMEIIGLHWLLAKTDGYHLTNYDSEQKQETTEYFHGLIDLCGDLGGSIMVLGSPQQRNFPAELSHQQAMENAQAVLERLTSQLAERKITLAIEPLGPEEGNFLNTADAGRELVERIDHSNVRLHLDVKAMSTEPTQITEIIRKHADVMAHFHANDPNRLGPGMGDVEFAPIIRMLDEVGYERWISVEVFDYSPGIEPILRQSIETLNG